MAITSLRFQIVAKIRQLRQSHVAVGLSVLRITSQRVEKIFNFPSMTRNAIACLESWADELLSRALRVRNLIGDAHWLSDGHHKEEIVREYLVRHLPQSLRVTRGFVCSTDADTRVSPEVDVLITDQESELPWFAEVALIITPPQRCSGDRFMSKRNSG